MNPKEMPLNYTYKKEGTDIWVLNTDDIPLPEDEIVDSQFIHIPPGNIGGNHKHPRTEYFIGLGEDLELVWPDDGKVQSRKMNPEGRLILFEIPPYLPHAVVNRSKDKSAVLIEYANDKMRGVEAVKII